MRANRKPSCDTCGKVFQRLRNLTVHKRIHTDERPYQCPYCERAFRYSSSYGVHVRSAHGVGKGLIKVGEVSTSEQTRTKLTTSLTAGRPVSNETVGKNYFGKRMLKDGKYAYPNSRRNAVGFASDASRGENPPGRTCLFMPTKFTCSICNMKYTNKATLESHMRLHRLTDSSADNENNPSATLSTRISAVCRRKKRSKVQSASTVYTNTSGTRVNGLMKIPSIQLDESTPSTNTPAADDTNESMNRTTEYNRKKCKPSLSLGNGGKGGFVHCKSSTTAGQQEICQRDQIGSEPMEVVDDGSVTEENQTVKKMAAENSSENDNRNEQAGTNSRTPLVFSCAECDVTFLKAKDLSQHMIHHPNYDKKSSGYRCPKCSDVFGSLINLRRHITLAHTKLEKLNVELQHSYECSICKLGFFSEHSFRKHKRLHKDYYKCEVCGKGFCNKREQLFHSKTHFTQSFSYKCQHCNCLFTCNTDRTRHILQMHSDSVKTDVEKQCGKINETNVSSTDDTRSFSNKCSQCGSSFSKKHLLQKHVMKVHWTEDNKVCKKKQRGDLGETDSSPESAIKRSTENATKFSCDTCGASYSRRYDLQKHITSKHYENDQNVVPLNDIMESDWKELNEDMLQEYDVAWTNVSRYRCDKCGVSCSTRIGLRRHILRKHYEIVQNVVPLNYTMASERRKDILREYVVAWDKINSVKIDPMTGKNFYICEICSTTYNSKAGLGIHIRNRAYDHGVYFRKRSEQIAERKRLLKEWYNCDICGKIFAKRYDMMLHRRRHTDEQFSSAGVRRNLYRTPDGTFVDIFGPVTQKPTAEREVSSSTCKDTETNDVRETVSDDASVYVDRADDELVAIESEPLFFARPYVTEEHSDEINSPNATENAPVTSGTRDCDGTIQGEYNMITNEQRNLHFVDKMQETTKDHTGLKDQMNLDTAYNMQNHLYRGQCKGIIEKPISVGPHNHTIIEQTNTHGLTNNIEQPSTCVQANTPEQTNNAEQRNSLNGMNGEMIPCTSSQCTDEVNTAELSSKSPLIFRDGNVCSACSICLLEGQNMLTCKLCDKPFCQLCSGLSTEAYNVLFKEENGCVNGFWWSCQICRLLVPKFTLLLQQLGDFEYIINNRLSDLEKRVLKITPN